LPLGPGASGSATATAAAATPTLAPGTVRVPDTIGMSEEEAEAAASAAGLRWRIEWVENGAEAPGIHDQEPPAGEIVQAGSPFVMFAWRAPD
jgi:beta-lactam-binding protein with PASTA domain